MKAGTSVPFQENTVLKIITSKEYVTEKYLLTGIFMK